MKTWITFVLWAWVVAPTVWADDLPYQPLVLERTAEGFVANGKSYIDPNARIEFMSAQSDTGYVVYAVRNAAPSLPFQAGHQYVVRRVAPLQNSKAEDLGYLDRSAADLWTYTDRSGGSYSGNVIVFGSRGILLSRSNKVLMYLAPEVTTKAIEVPDGFGLAPLQKGDVSFTQHVLLMRELQPKVVWGFTVTNNIKEHLMAQLNVGTGDLTTTFHMQLYRDQPAAKTLEIFYFVFGTARGPLQITMEDGRQRIVVRNLATNKMRVAFERDAGISLFRVERHKDGVIRIDAGLGFHDEHIEDVETFLAMTPDSAPQ